MDFETTIYNDDFRNYKIFMMKDFNPKDFKSLKRTMTLDLESPVHSRKQRFDCVLTSPDVQLLKIGTPELDKLAFLNQGLMGMTPTPSGMGYGTGISGTFLFTKHVTEEQENFSLPFEEALAKIKNSESQKEMDNADSNDNCISHNQDSSASSEFITLETAQPSFQSYSIQIKEEPQQVPISVTSLISQSDRMSSDISDTSSQPMSPIDMKSQEDKKLERKRLRNRVAASKCRKRKLDRISQLEENVKELTSANSQLELYAANLKEEVKRLLDRVQEHQNKGCAIQLTEKYCVN